MFLMRKYLFALSLFVSAGVFAQDSDDGVDCVIPLCDGLEYNIEMQFSLSSGRTPLWLNANRYGLSSLEKSNGYIMAGVSKPLQSDSARRWGLGFGLDMAVPYNYTSKVVIQQAYIEGRWLHGVLTLGSKEYPMELKNNTLSSGSQTLGINARPIPQARVALPEYWTVPLTKGWLHMKGHVAFGKMTDDNWQHDFTECKNKYVDNVLYHSKAAYLKIGNEAKQFPFSIEMGMEMAATFGGTTYMPDGKGGMMRIDNNSGLKAFVNAFIPGGYEAVETTYQNVEGNHLGSWLMRLNWDAGKWRLGVYADKFFEDHSGMFFLDYDGYGKGPEWHEKKDNRYFLYALKDIMLGAELNLKNGTWLRNVVVEYIYSKYQSGPIYHDHTSAVPDHLGGKDNFYNHYIYTGWQHWGQVIGNPLYRSPIYNDDNNINVQDNRFMAFHVGIDGRPAKRFSYRVLASWQEGLGTYDDPYDKVRYNFSFLVEGEYSFSGRLLDGWRLKGGYAMDFGKILGNNRGFQITVSKSGLLNL